MAEARDPKGLYRRRAPARSSNFTGIDSPYEAPEAADLHLRTLETTVDDEVNRIIEALEQRGVFD